jgi:anti-sigma factor RsiW
VEHLTDHPDDDGRAAASSAEPARPDPATDPDLALLESYLDGELSAAELAALQQRLGGDTELSAALARLSSEYTVRQAVWSALEGTNAETERVTRGVKRAVRHVGFWERSGNALRVGAAVAACLVCFVAGWVGRGTTATAANVPSTRPVAEPGLVYQVALTDEGGNITAVQKFDNLDEAKSFAADVGKWQAQQVQIQNGQPVLTRSGL